MRRTVLIHHHIFKNAGTSFNHALEKAFDKQFLEFDLPRSQVVTQAHLASFLADQPAALAVSGHHICLPTPQSEAVQTLSSVLLRKPLSRIRSIYEFERKQNAQTEGAVMAKQLSFKEFVIWRLETSPHVFCNYQTLYCARTDNLYAKYTPTQTDLNLALENLKACLVVGTVERYSEFLLMAQYELKRYYPEIVLRNLHLNITAKPAAKKISTREMLVEELGQEIIEKLEEMNHLDEQLYQFADQQTSNWLTQDVQAKADYFEATGNWLLNNGQWQDAKEAFQRALTVHPRWFKPHYGLGATTEKLENLDNAIQHYRKAIELNPDFTWSYFKIGNIFYEKKIYEEAIDYYQQAAKLHPREKSFFILLKLGDALLAVGKINEAIELYLQAEQVNPSSPDVKLKLSSVYRKREDWQLSEHFALKALEIFPESCEAYIGLRDIALAKGEIELAAEYSHKVVKFELKNLTREDESNNVYSE